MTVSHEPTRWRKSSLSSGQDTCVELAHTRDSLRDSKNVHAPALGADIADLIAAVKSGRLR